MTAEILAIAAVTAGSTAAFAAATVIGRRGAPKDAAWRADDDALGAGRALFDASASRAAEEAARNCREAAEEALRAAETARLASTGIEFGGTNPDPNLNPGMGAGLHGPF